MKSDFINFLYSSGILCFGEFVTKSGRKTPYFFNFGNANTGSALKKLGSFYAQFIFENVLRPKMNIHIAQNNERISPEWSIFGPAYKGIPLATSIVIELFTSHNVNTAFTANRKEEKQRGEGGTILGFPLCQDTRLVIVDDVVTSGSTLHEILPLIRTVEGIVIDSFIIAVDREEKGLDSTLNLSAIAEIGKKHLLTIKPIVTLSEVITYFSQENDTGFILDNNLQSKIQTYREKYCV
jgi:orotate phosphoribosyltransferase